jgi:hypothetical protein
VGKTPVMFKQVPNERWNRHYDFIDLCEVNLSVLEFSSMFHISFEKVPEDGLGVCHYACVDLSNQLFLVFGVPDENSRSPGVIFRAPGNLNSVSEGLASVCAAMEIAQCDLNWSQDYFEKPEWILVRQGDDGNEVEITRFYNKEVAENNMKLLEARGHKQYYNVKKLR